MINEFPKENFVMVWNFNGDIHSMKFSWVSGALAAYDFTTDSYDFEHGVTLSWASKLDDAYIILTSSKPGIN